jgi:DNA-binding MarR family transcriptional regulator
MPVGKQMAARRSTPPPSDDHDVAHRLRTAVGRLSRRLRSTAAGAGLTPTDTSVLFSVVRHGPLGVSELAAVEDLNPTMLSRVVARLCERGLATRTADPDDRRAALVAATARGVRLRATIQRERADALGRQLDALPAERRAALEAALPALEELAERLRERST